MMETSRAKPEIVASARNWIEGAAVQQLERAAQPQGMLRAVGMPDLHPGNGSPIGAAFLSEGVVYPALVGNDIGCGMGLWMLDVSARKTQLDKWEKRLRGLEQPWDGDAPAWLAAHDAAPCGFEDALGTIGGGHHFAELRRVICEDRDLLYEEAPQAHKNVDVVVQDLVDAGLASIAAVLRPLLTYKTRSRDRE